MASRTRPLLMHRLRVTMLGIDADLHRDIWVDGALALGTLHRIITAAFDRSTDRQHEDDVRHLFTERVPEFPVDSGREPFYDDNPEASAGPRFGGWHWDPNSWDSSGRHRSAPRRWGDRWTMIEWRDPHIVDEATVTIGATLAAQHPLFYSLGIDGRWWFRIESVGVEMRQADAERVELASGLGRDPLAICRDAPTWNTWMTAASDPTHDDHAETTERLDAAVGPWATFDAAEFDERAARERVARSATPSQRNRSEWRDTHRDAPIDRLIGSLPPDARAGLRRHLESAGVRGSSVLPAAEAATQVAAFCRVVINANQGATTTSGLAEEDGDDRVRVAAKRLGLLYPRKGRLIPTIRARDAARDPLALREIMANEILRRRVPAHPLGVLILLAIADGSIMNRDGAFSRIAAALHACDSERDSGWDDFYGGYSRLRRSTTQEVERSFDSLAQVLVPLGLRQADDGTLTPSRALIDFARRALH